MKKLSDALASFRSTALRVKLLLLVCLSGHILQLQADRLNNVKASSMP